ncbi:MAG: carboxypeptidase-like regulatory domain-containing protein [Pirellulales bacterium]
MRIAKYCFVALILPLSLSGCQKGSSLKTVAVSGRVTLDGQPIEGATVSFLSKAGIETGHTASGITNAEGHYELQTYEATNLVKGAVPGEYNVIIAKYEAPKGLTKEQTEGMIGGGSPEKARAMSGALTEEQKQAASGLKGEAAAAAGGGLSKTMLPKKYASPTDSGLSATVAADQKTPIDFQLTE